MFTGFRTSMRFGVLVEEEVKAILATTYPVIDGWPEPMQDNLIYFPAIDDYEYGPVASILFSGQCRKRLEMPEYHSKSFAADHKIFYPNVGCLFGYDPKRLGEIRIFSSSDEALVLKRRIGGFGRACWDVEYIGTDEGRDAERIILPLIVKSAAGHDRYVAVCSYAGRDADFLQEAGLSLPRTQQSPAYMERHWFRSGR